MPKKFDPKYQIEVMGMVGYAIYQCQQVEATISQCWLLFSKTVACTDGKNYFEVWNINDVTAKNERKTIGNLLFQINPARWFTQKTEQRLSRFVRDRNRLVHHVFRESQFKSVKRRRDLERVHKLASQVFEEGRYFEQLFDAILGMQYDIGYKQGFIQMSNRAAFLGILEGKEQRGEFAEMSKAMKKLS